jgi:ZIP family zinc transporter
VEHTRDLADSLAIFWYGTLGSLLAGLGTGVGAFGIVLMRRRPSPRTEDAMLSAAAGVMLAATFFSLLLPALDRADVLIGHRLGAVGMVAGGLLLGALGLYLVHRYVPHEHFLLGKEGPDSKRLERIWLFVIAITLHNFPEGMAVGVGFGGGDVGNGVSLAIGIGLQNVPEGFAVAISLLSIGYAPRTAFWVAMLTGLVEPVGGAIGAAAVSLAEPLMPAILGVAAGAMLFVISDEIIPETHRRGYETVATFSLLGGFAVMMVLDTVFA